MADLSECSDESPNAHVQKAREIKYRRDAPGVLDKILGHIAYYCIDHTLPPLTSIVVGQGRGMPGQDIPMNLAKRDKEREKVYATDWYDIYPPCAQELHASYESH